MLVGELARRTRLVELVDAELSAARGVRAVKARRRGLSPGALVVSLSECEIAGAECFDDIENVRADTAGATLRAVAATPCTDGTPTRDAFLGVPTSARSSERSRGSVTASTASSVET